MNSSGTANENVICVDKLWLNFMSAFLKVADCHAPLIQKRVRGVDNSLPADVLWGSFVTHSFLPYGRLLRDGPFVFWWVGCANPPKNIEQMFLVKKKFLAEFLRRKKKSSSLINLCVAKDFAWCVTAPKVAVSHMIQDWASHFLCVNWYFASATHDLLIRFPIKVNPLI